MFCCCFKERESDPTIEIFQAFQRYDAETCQNILKNHSLEELSPPVGPRKGWPVLMMALQSLEYQSEALKVVLIAYADNHEAWNAAQTFKDDKEGTIFDIIKRRQIQNICLRASSQAQTQVSEQAKKILTVFSKRVLKEKENSRGEEAKIPLTHSLPTIPTKPNIHLGPFTKSASDLGPYVPIVEQPIQD
ncbi:MAG: hypothetical protein AAGI90_02205 [Chlamydiota bacterium]